MNPLTSIAIFGFPIFGGKRKSTASIGLDQTLLKFWGQPIEINDKTGRLIETHICQNLAGYIFVMDDGEKKFAELVSYKAVYDWVNG